MALGLDQRQQCSVIIVLEWCHCCPCRFAGKWAVVFEQPHPLNAELKESLTCAKKTLRFQRELVAVFVLAGVI